MASSHHEVKTCRDIVPYKPLVQINENAEFMVLAPTPISSQPLQNDVGTIKVPQEDVVTKSRLVTTIVKGTTFVNFMIVPFKGEDIIYTIKAKENVDEPSDPYGLNLEYYEKLHGWKAQRRQRQSGKCEMFYFHKSKSSMCQFIAEVRRHIFQGDKLKLEIEPMTKTVKRTVVEAVEKRSKKRKGESSLSENKSVKRNTKAMDTTITTTSRLKIFSKMHGTTL